MQSNPNVIKEKKRCHSDDIVTIDTLKEEATGVSDGQKKMEAMLLNVISNINSKVDQVNERVTNYRNQTIPTTSSVIQHTTSKKKIIT